MLTIVVAIVASLLATGLIAALAGLITALMVAALTLLMVVGAEIILVFYCISSIVDSRRKRSVLTDAGAFSFFFVVVHVGFCVLIASRQGLMEIDFCVYFGYWVN